MEQQINIIDREYPHVYILLIGLKPKTHLAKPITVSHSPSNWNVDNNHVQLVT